MDQAQPRDQDLIAQVRRFNRSYTALLGLLRTHYLGNPVSFVEARVLFDVDRLGDCRAVDLAGSLGLDRGYLSRLLKGLEGKGLIKKNPAPQDRRSRLLVLTRRGRTILSRLNLQSDGIVSQLLAGLSQEEREELVQAMNRISQLLGQGRNGPA